MANKTVTKEQMIGYLQEKMDKFKAHEAKYVFHNEYVQDELNEMIACKEMVEALIGEPVNLQLDGKVTTGF